MADRRPATYRADVVIPCYLEEDALPISVPHILAYFSGLADDPGNRLAAFRLILVDDGSHDRTWELIEGFARDHAEVEGLRLSRNFGHQAAMLAGLYHADADVIVTMDADLQDDIDAIAAMIASYENGAHLALGVRNDRTSDSLRKYGAAHVYYRLLALLGVNIIENHADFRLMSRTALDALLQHQEVNLFLRGLIPRLGFSVTLIPYKRRPRTAGETKYTLRKMIRLAIDGVTSFSIAPLRIIAVTGGLIFIGTMVVSLFFLWAWFNLPGSIVPGWASTVLPMLFLGGMQLLSIGVLGEYVGKIYLETKRRPRFIVQDRIGEGLESSSAARPRPPFAG